MKLSTILLLIGICTIINGFQIQPFFKTDKLQLEDEPNQCNQTNFFYVNLQKIYKNSQEMNATLKKRIFWIGEIQTAIWHINETKSITIFVSEINITQINPTRTAKFVAPNFYLIEGQFVEVNAQIYYEIKSGSQYKYGKFTVKGISKEIVYSIVVNQNQPEFALSNISKITFPPLNIINYEVFHDSSLTEGDKFLLNYLLNTGASNVSSLKQNIEIYLQLKIPPNLNQSISQYSYERLNQYTYRFNGFRSIQIDFVNNRNKNYRYDQTGQYYGSESYVKSQTNQRCGPTVATSPMNAKIFGDNQEFVSYTLLENALVYSMNQDQYRRLDTNLSRDYWGTKSFKFTAGELATAFSSISDTFKSPSEAQGYCKTSDPSKMKITKGSNTTINLHFTTSCSLQIQTKTIVQFDLALKFKAEGVPDTNQTNFELESFDFNSTYNDSFGFKLLNKTRADSFVADALGKLGESKLLGSGWPLVFEKQNPVFLALENAFLVYDKPVGVQKSNQS